MVADSLARREALKAWLEEGQQRWQEEEVVAGVVGDLRLVLVYQPSWGAD